MKFEPSSLISFSVAVTVTPAINNNTSVSQNSHLAFKLYYNPISVSRVVFVTRQKQRDVARFLLASYHKKCSNLKNFLTNSKLNDNSELSAHLDNNTVCKSRQIESYIHDTKVV